MRAAARFRMARRSAGRLRDQAGKARAALFAAAILAAALVWLIGAIERVTLRRMGLAR